MTGTPQPRWGRWLWCASPYAVGALCLLAMAALYLGYSQARAGTMLSAPLDDTFIHFQYAKQLANGEFLRFNDGDSPTTGATSLLYMFLLAPGWLLGFRGLNLLIWAWIINSALHVRAGVALFQLLRRVSGGYSAGAYGGMLVFLCCGPLLWGVFSQMEIALFSALIMLTLEAAHALSAEDTARGEASTTGRWTTRRRLLLWGSLMAITRPEGALLAGGLTLWLLWRHLGARPAETGWRRHLRDGLPWLWPLASGVALTLLFAALTGRLGTNANVKSTLNLLPFESTRYWESSLRHLPMTLEIMLEKLPAFTAPVTTTLCFLGLAGWAARGKPRRPGAGLLVLGWLLLLTLFFAFIMARRDHFDRYYLPYMGLLVAAIFWPLCRLAASRASLRLMPAFLSALLLPFMGPVALHWAQRYGDNCRDLAHQHFKAAAWVDKNIPATASIAVNDAGAIPYLTGRYTFDIVGLGHNAFYKVKNYILHSDAPAWEALGALERKPDYFVAYPEWLPQMNHLPFFTPIHRVTLHNRSVVANETKVVWRMNWDGLAPSHTLPARFINGRKLVDRLNVTHVSSEKAHGYKRVSDVAPRGDVRSMVLEDGNTLVEGGRPMIKGEEERFTLQAEPGKPALLVMRAAGPGELDLELQINDDPGTPWRAALVEEMSLASAPIDSGQIDGDRITVRIKANRGYTSYHYWLVQ